MSTQDYGWGISCSLVPDQQPLGPGWYIIGANDRVESGPFPTPVQANATTAWLERRSLGVHPQPWRLYQSKSGLLIGSRLRPPRMNRRPLLDTTP